MQCKKKISKSKIFNKPSKHQHTYHILRCCLRSPHHPFYHHSPLPPPFTQRTFLGGISPYPWKPPRSHRFYVDKFLSPLLRTQPSLRFVSYRSYIIGRFNPCVRSAVWKQIFSLLRKQYRRWKSCANNKIDWTRFRRKKRRKIIF